MCITGILLDKRVQHLPFAKGSARRFGMIGVVVLLLCPPPVSHSSDEADEPDRIAVEIHEVLSRIRSDRTSGALYLRLAELYRERGNLAAARASAEESLELGLSTVDSDRAELILADIALTQGRSHEATTRLQGLFDRSSASPSVMARLAQLKWDDRFRSEALVLAMEAVRRDPEPTERLRWVAERWKEAGRIDQALILWESIVRRADSVEEDLFQVGYLSQRLERDQRALDVYLELLGRSPNHPEAHYNLSILLLALADTTEAIGHLQAAIRADPELRPAYLDLVIVFLRRKENGRARQALTELRAHAGADSAINHYVDEMLRSIED